MIRTQAIQSKGNTIQDTTYLTRVLEHISAAKPIGSCHRRRLPISPSHPMRTCSTEPRGGHTRSSPDSDLGAPFRWAANAQQLCKSADGARDVARYPIGVHMNRGNKKQRGQSENHEA